MRRTLLQTVSILGALLVWSSNVSAQPLDSYYVRYPRAEPYPPSYYAPPPNYAPPPPSYVVPPDYRTPRASTPYVGYDDARAYRYSSPPIAEYVPPAPVLIPLRPRSCGRYRFWNGEYCADARYERPYLGPRW